MVQVIDLAEGKDITAFCPYCGKKLLKDSSYCAHCGNQITDIHENIFSLEDKNTHGVVDFIKNKKNRKKIITVVLCSIFLIIYQMCAYENIFKRCYDNFSLDAPSSSFMTFDPETYEIEIKTYDMDLDFENYLYDVNNFIGIPESETTKMLTSTRYSEVQFFRKGRLRVSWYVPYSDFLYIKYRIVNSN